MNKSIVSESVNMLYQHLLIFMIACNLYPTSHNFLSKCFTCFAILTLKWGGSPIYPHNFLQKEQYIWAGISPILDVILAFSNMKEWIYQESQRSAGRFTQPSYCFVADPSQPGALGDSAMVGHGSTCKIMSISCGHWSQCNLDPFYILYSLAIWPLSANQLLISTYNSPIPSIICSSTEFMKWNNWLDM